MTACRQDMHIQPRYDAFEATPFFGDGRSERPTIADTVARGQLHLDDARYTGKENGKDVDFIPIQITEADVERGHERFDIYCSPCHGRLGDGRGMIVMRGLSQPPSYYEPRLVTAPIGHFFDVMTNGYGAMFSYASRVANDDRWRIAAYIRALQLGRNAPGTRTTAANTSNESGSQHRASGGDSVSSHQRESNEPIPDIRLGPEATRIERVSGVIGAIGILLCIVAFFWNRQEFYQSYLFAFLYWGGFSIGGLGVLVLNHTVGGRWGVTSRRFMEAQMRTLPLLLLFFIVLLFGMNQLYPWMHPNLVPEPSRAYLYHKRAYLNWPFFLIRTLVYFAIWLFWGIRLYKWSDKQDETGDPGLRERMRKFSAPGCLIVTFTATFAYIDWILSADAQFFSTIYGAMILFGDVLQTFALTILVMVLASRGDRFGGRVNAVVLHDIGNMMFAFTIFWTYLSVSQLIIVWPANLPQEIGWYLVRVRGGWRVIAAAVSLVMFAIPFLALLSQARKRDPIRLMRVAIWILAARVVDIFWIVEPTFRTKGFAIYWTDFAAFIGVGGIWVYVFLGQLRKRPLLPLRDPRVMTPLPEAAH